MASPVVMYYGCPSGGSIVAGIVMSSDPMKWATVPDIGFVNGTPKSVSVKEFLPNGGDIGNIIYSYAGSLPVGVTFNVATASFEFSGSGSGSASVQLVAKSIPCFATIAFKPTLGTYSSSNSEGNPAHIGYPFSFSHLFNDGQVLPGTTVYCLTVKNGVFGDDSASNKISESFRCDPIDYYASGCLKNATLSGVIMAVFLSNGLVCSHTFDLIAIGEAQAYGSAPVAPLPGIVTPIYDSTGVSLSSTSLSFTVGVT